MQVYSCRYFFSNLLTWKDKILNHQSPYNLQYYSILKQTTKAKKQPKKKKVMLITDHKTKIMWKATKHSKTKNLNQIK